MLKNKKKILKNKGKMLHNKVICKYVRGRSQRKRRSRTRSDEKILQVREEKNRTRGKSCYRKRKICCSSFLLFGLR